MLYIATIIFSFLFILTHSQAIFFPIKTCALRLIFFNRYVAIVYPIKAHALCSRKRMMSVVCAIWPSTLLLASPVAVWNTLLAPQAGSELKFCVLRFPGNQRLYQTLFKYGEFLLFYLLPLLIQLVCYSVVCKQLFAGAAKLHRVSWRTMRRSVGMGSSKVRNKGKSQHWSEAMQARRDVVKMLIVSVAIYFISYLPHQVLLFYNTFSPTSFHRTWIFLALVTAMGYVCSASNPILCYIFSRAFRQKFDRFLQVIGWKRGPPEIRIEDVALQCIAMATPELTAATRQHSMSQRGSFSRSQRGSFSRSRSPVIFYGQNFPKACSSV